MATTTEHRAEGKGSSRRKRCRLRWEYVLLACAMGFFAYKFLEKTQQIQQWQQQRAALQYENGQTAGDNARLQRNIRYFRTPGYVNDAARAELGLTKAGELAIVPAVRHPVPKVQAAPPVPPAPPPPTWQQWWHSFFG